MIHRYNLPPEVTKVNPLISEDPADTLYRVADALKSFAESLVNEAACSGGDAATIGRASMLDVCASTLEFQAEVIERARGEWDNLPPRPDQTSETEDETPTATAPENQADTDEMFLGVMRGGMEYHGIPEDLRRQVLEILGASLKKEPQAA